MKIIQLYSRHLVFRQSVPKLRNRSVGSLHENCVASGNTAESSSAKRIKALFIGSPKEGGFSLIEVMLATLILSMGLLAFAQGQLAALRISEHAYFINLADLKNNELAERIRSCSNKSFCIQEQLELWREEVRPIFPQGEEHSMSQGAEYQSKISWFSIYPSQKLTQSLSLLFRL